MRVKQRIFTFFNKQVKTEKMDISHTTFNKFKQSLDEEEEIERRMQRIKIEEGSEISDSREKSDSSSVVFEKIPENQPNKPEHSS